ncbi:MAG TPA: G8 domain-containing protein, partial [Bacteroidia bacterium]|nr:G8 domain-containing protein [Bacteroidia bacterium]
MKHITTPKILVLLFCLAALEMHSAQMTAIANGGDWSDAATWSGLREPDDNDTLTIDAGMQVVVDINSPEYVNLRVNVNGELYFEGGQKINMCPGSVFVSGTGVLNGGNPGSKIDECGNTVWNGPGPTYGGGTYGNTTLPVELVSFAAAQSGKDVQISWSTASESNCSHFNV